MVLVCGSVIGHEWKALPHKFMFHLFHIDCNLTFSLFEVKLRIKYLCTYMQTETTHKLKVK